MHVCNVTVSQHDVLSLWRHIWLSGNSASRKALTDAYPDAPRDNRDLEAQQRALLNAQNDMLKQMKYRPSGMGININCIMTMKANFPLCTPRTWSSDWYLLDAVYQFVLLACHVLGICLLGAWQSMDKHYQAIVKQVPSICQLFDICLIIACQMFCAAAWQVIVKHLASKYQAHVKQVSRNWHAIIWQN